MVTDFRYIPFGGGPRKCIGDQFALLEAVTVLSLLTRRFDFELDPASPAVGMTTGATIHTTHGLNLLVKKRRDVPPPAQPRPAAAAPATAGGSAAAGGSRVAAPVSESKCPVGF